MNVSAKKLTYVVLTILMLFAIGYYYMATYAIREIFITDTLGPRQFPRILSILLAISCIFSFIQTLKREDHIITFPNYRMIIVTIIFTSLYFISWKEMGYFYLNTFIFLLLLLIVYQIKLLIRKNLLINLIKNFLIALGVTVFIYFLFEIIIGIRF